MARLGVPPTHLGRGETLLRLVLPWTARLTLVAVYLLVSLVW
jgi:hypothetical protein